jgi:N-acetylmuramoyl-L-alanine amidase
MMKSKKVSALLMAFAMAFSIVQPAAAATYQVTSGDSLYTIGKLFNTSTSTIMSDNKLSTSSIYPGQVLYVPGQTYTVQNGDSIFLVARKFGISMYTLRDANNLWSDSIYPGQKLAIPGQASSAVIASSTPSQSGAVISYTASDLDLLARLIQAEAGDQPYNAMVGVGAVVVSRVQNPLYPSTVSGVINEVSGGYHQFTPVVNGYINNPATQTAKNAAYAALHGSDPTNGALYYFDDSATNTWLWSKPLAAKIGRMVFVYR